MVQSQGWPTAPFRSLPWATPGGTRPCTSPVLLLPPRALPAGDGGHAGAQLMPLRNDAALGAAELALAVEAAVLATGGWVLAVWMGAGWLAGRGCAAVFLLLAGGSNPGHCCSSPPPPPALPPLLVLLPGRRPAPTPPAPSGKHPPTTRARVDTWMNALNT